MAKNARAIAEVPLPYDVSGWVESTILSPAEQSKFGSHWRPLLSLGFFGLRGDSVSDYLFGLSKQPASAGLFGRRGVPPDCSPTVSRDLAANDAFIALHGEGDFGHTFAGLNEIQAALHAEGAPEVVESQWAHVLGSLEHILSAPPFGMAPYCRMIVWANW